MSATGQRLRRWLRRAITAALGGALGAAIVLAACFDLDPLTASAHGLRWAATPVAAAWYATDAERAQHLAARDHRGGSDDGSVCADWQRFEHVGLTATPQFAPLTRFVPMVSERIDAPHVVELRSTFALVDLVAAQPDEYAAMSALAALVGTAWDHGRDAITDGPTGFAAATALTTGRGGRRYHCAIAARTLAQCATAVGFDARVVTISADGYQPQHTVCELWSNQFGKWFVADADFNVVYVHAGVPRSAIELCQHGVIWAQQGQLELRAFAPRKPSLPRRDMLPSYATVHLDLRTDWRSRPLPRGSPAGGDLATWYATRPPLGRLLTARRYVTEAATFDWPVNRVRLRLRDVERDGHRLILRVEPAAYSPQWVAWQWQLDEQPWVETTDAAWSVAMPAGRHRLATRVRTRGRWPGPTTQVELDVAERR